MIKKQLALLTLTSLLLVGCSTNTDAEGEKTNSLESESSEVATKEVENHAFNITLVNTPNGQDVYEDEMYNGNDKDSAETFNYYQDMMSELAPVVQDQWDSTKIYENSTGQPVTYSGTVVSSEIENDGDILRSYDIGDAQDKFDKPNSNFLMIGKKGSSNSDLAYDYATTTYGEGEDEHPWAATAQVVYEKGDTFIVLFSDLVNKEDMSEQGQAMIDVFQSEEATAIYDKHIK